MVVAALLLVSVNAPYASECAPIAGGSTQLGRIDAEVRLRFLRDRLRVAARKSRIWNWTWAGLYTGLTVVDLALLDGASHAKLIDNGVGASVAFIGLMSVALVPQDVIADQFWLERRLRRAPQGTDTCALLADAERLLIRDAKSSAFGKGVLVQLGNFLVNMAALFVLGSGYHHWDQAALQGLGGLAIGEVQILSQPNDTVHDLRRYRAGNLGLPPAWRPIGWALAPMAGQGVGGLIVGLSF